MTTNIEHDTEKLTVKGVDRLSPDSEYYKKGWRYGKNDGDSYTFFGSSWREVPQPRNVTGEFTPIDRYIGLKQANGHLQRGGNLIVLGNLPVGCYWRKDQAIVLPEDWVNQLITIHNKSDDLHIEDTQRFLKQFEQSVLLIKKEGGG